MTNTKKQTNTKPKDNNKDLTKLQKENDNLKNVVDKQSEMLDEFKKQLEQMKTAMVEMTKYAEPSRKTEDDSLIEVCCRLVNGVDLYSPKRDISRFIPYGKTVEFDKEEFSMLIKSNFVRNFLQKGVLYFVDDVNYEKYRIHDRLDLDDDKLIDMITNKTENQLSIEFNKYTREKRDDVVVHSLFYRIVDLYIKGKLNNMSYQNRKFIEKYFKCAISSAEISLRRLNEIK